MKRIGDGFFAWYVMIVDLSHQKIEHDKGAYDEKDLTVKEKSVPNLFYQSNPCPIPVRRDYVQKNPEPRYSDQDSGLSLVC